MKSTTILALILGFQLAITHIVASKLSLYWEISWFDNLMHVFGGVTLALLLYTLVDINLLAKTWVVSVRRAALLMFAVLIAWEVLGVLIIGRFKDNFVGDTASDLIMGTLGCIIGWSIGRIIKKLEL